MSDALGQVSWIGIVVATVALTGLGAAYFLGVVPAAYLRVLGRDATQPPEQSALAAVGPLVCNLLTVVTSAVLIAAIGIDSAAGAVGFGLVVGVGYLSAMTFQIAINPNFPHPIRYGLLNAPYFVVSSVVACVILVLL